MAAEKPKWFSAPAISIVLLMTGFALTPKIDRNLNLGSAQGGRISRTHHRSKVFISLFLMIVLAIGMMTILSQQPQGPDDAPFESPVPARNMYYEHAPILIDGNAGFLGSNASTGISWGSGTEDDPYIISDWDINPSSARGIEIRNSTAHFTIRNCWICDGISTGHSGISLLNCTNGALIGNNCSNNADGISLSDSSNNTIFNNNCHSNKYTGIVLGLRCNNNTLSNNTCNSHDYSGILLFRSCNNNTLSNNTCNSNYLCGMYLCLSYNDTLSNNTCSLNSNHGILLDSASNNTLSSNICSSNNYCGIWLYRSSSNNTLSNNTCRSNINFGIWLFRSNNNNTITGNDLCENVNGILVGRTDSYEYGNEFTWNRLCDNIDYGIYVVSGISNRIWNNTFYHNNGAGDTYDSLHIQACDIGTNNLWNSSDGYGNWWSDWTIPDDDPPDGIVDEPYNISGNAGAKDYYPLTTTPTEPIPEFGAAGVVIVVIIAIPIVLALRKGKGAPTVVEEKKVKPPTPPDN